MPKLQEYMPKLQECVSKLQEYVPKLQEYVPKLQECGPKLQEYVPKLQEYVPKLQECVAKLQGYVPKLQECVSKLQEYVPKLQEATPKLQESKPQVIEPNFKPSRTHSQNRKNPVEYHNQLLHKKEYFKITRIIFIKMLKIGKTRRNGFWRGRIFMIEKEAWSLNGILGMIIIGILAICAVLSFLHHHY